VQPTVRPVHAPVALWSWLALGVVVALLGTLLLVKVIGGSDLTGASLVATSPQILHEVTGVPASVTDAVGVASPTVPVHPPTVVSRAPLLIARAPDGARLPEVLYVGTEFCSFCAAERWPLIVALSRFGTFDTLFNMQSSLVDYAPGTPTFTFRGTSYESTYVAFRPFEVQSDVLGPRGYNQLMRVPAAVRAVLARFDPTSTYPFVDVANRVVVRQADLSPETLAGLTRDEIAAGLSDPTSAVTQAILVAANELTASICHVDGKRPGTVCGSIGVRKADSLLGLSG
jgi:hypothetical protein